MATTIFSSLPVRNVKDLGALARYPFMLICLACLIRARFSMSHCKRRIHCSAPIIGSRPVSQE
jgi:hypothetical protein